MKKISIVVPCYNEEANVEPLRDALVEMFRRDLPGYRYEILFIDNDSQDHTREILRRMCGGGQAGQGHFQRQELRPVQLPLLRDAADGRGLHHFDGRGFPGSGGDDPQVCGGVGERLQDRHRHQEIQPGKSGDVLAAGLLLQADPKALRRGTDRAVYRLRPLRPGLHKGVEGSGRPPPVSAGHRGGAGIPEKGDPL